MSLNVTFHLTNPFAKPVWKAGPSWDIRITKNKAIELQLMRPSWREMLVLAFSWRDRHFDHHGVSFEVGVFGIGFSVDFYDRRHADDIDWDV